MNRCQLAACVVLSVSLFVQLVLHRSGAQPTARHMAELREDEGGKALASQVGRARKASAFGSSRRWSVDESCIEKHLLLSELQSHDHRQSFTLRNVGAGELQLVLKSASCGCMGFEVGDQPIAVGSHFCLAAFATSVFTARFPLSGSAGAIARTFDIGELNGAAASPRRLIARIETHNDLVVDPPMIRCVLRGGSPTTAGFSLKITVCTRGEPLTTAAVHISADEPLLFSGIALDGPPEQLADGLWRQRFQAQLAVDESRLRAFIASEDRAIRVALQGSADAPATTFALPVYLSDASRLEAPAVVHFGTVPLGTTSKRSLLVSSRDSGSFCLRDAAAEGAGTVGIAMSNRAGRYQIVSVSFTPSSLGDQDGRICLTPSANDYSAVTIKYSAHVRERGDIP